MTAIKHDILNYDNIRNAVQLMFKLFKKYFYESCWDKIYRDKIISILGIMSTNAIVSNIAKAVKENAPFIHVVFKLLLMLFMQVILKGERLLIR